MAQIRHVAGIACRACLLARAGRPLSTIPTVTTGRSGQTDSRHVRHFRPAPSAQAVKPYLLADIGEGITECQIIQWFVQPGARVQQFDKICEVQSDKASVEITSRYDGIVRKLYHDADDMAKVGQPLVDIDVEDDSVPAVEPASLQQQPPAVSPPPSPAAARTTPVPTASTAASTSGKHASLATPAVRHLLKDRGLEISQIVGTGKDGRVLKEDVLRHATAQPSLGGGGETSTPSVTATVTDTAVPLTGIQKQMFKAMTRSLAIPHFLYTDNVDFSALTRLRAGLSTDGVRLSPLPFIVKAVSVGLAAHPALNAHLDTSDPDRPTVTVKQVHNVGIAVDTRLGLVVPVVQNVGNLTIAEISAEISRLSVLARDGRLTTADLAGATITVSNIGSIGGTAVAPVVVSPQVAILGIGRARKVPAFGPNGEVVAREEAVFSWSADHRVVDGAAMARFADDVRRMIEQVERMLVRMK